MLEGVVGGFAGLGTIHTYPSRLSDLSSPAITERRSAIESQETPDSSFEFPIQYVRARRDTHNQAVQRYTENIRIAEQIVDGQEETNIDKLDLWIREEAKRNLGSSDLDAPVTASDRELALEVQRICTQRRASAELSLNQAQNTLGMFITLRCALREQTSGESNQPKSCLCSTGENQ
jgi:hypothetical protein